MSAIEKSAIENTLFDYTYFEQLDTVFFQFIDCTMKVDIGQVKAGDEVTAIEINYETSTLTVYNEDGNEIVSAKISLVLSDITVPL